MIAQPETKMLLAIEASTRELSVALFTSGNFLREDYAGPSNTRHAETLMPMIDALLKAESLAVRDLDAIAVTRGPGSFTSVRIGLATALGLAYPAKIPVYAIPTLEVLAAAAEEDATAYRLPLLDARKGQVYGALYRPGLPLEDPALSITARKADEWANRAAEESGEAPVLVMGDGFDAYADAIASVLGERLCTLPQPATLQARRLGERVLARLDAGLPFDLPHPLYARKPEAVVNLEARGSK